MEDRIREMKDLIARAKIIDEEFRQDFVDNSIEGKKRFQESEKGRESVRKGWRKRSRLIFESWAKNSWEEKQLVKQFYRNTPKGYQVDHIIPISKGGQHCISNLQYLTPEQNRRKFNNVENDELQDGKYLF